MIHDQKAVYDAENPRTLWDVLWAWSDGHLSLEEAVRRSGADDIYEFFEVALNHGVPLTGRLDRETPG